MPARPLSPHLSVYRMYRYTLLTSFLNRATGVVLSLALVLLVYWLAAVAGGAQAQARAARLLGLPVMKLVYAACIIAFCYHLVAGIRHLVWDTGHGLERAQSRNSAWLVLAASVLLMLLIGAFAFVLAGRAP
ncbi:MAG TPA: succinate dehydrogenase, cytochrome b556 subunit [Steroidobacteraceae bacterium]|nr:succinate dehydrogenase, cytochrome b556 subunit [Steroidobacteraceae bacterium]